MTEVQRRWVLGGGIASGKSLVRRFLDDAGVPTIDADSVGHAVLEPDGEAFDEVSSRWPEVVTDGTIDRTRLGGIVFGDATQLSELESVTHPHIFGIIRAQVEKIDSGVVVEMPLAGRRLGDDWRQLVVDCRDEIRVERAVARGMAEDDVRARMASQPSREGWLVGADLVVPNHGSMDELKATVRSLIPHL